MSSQIIAIGLNNCGVSLLERGLLWQALEKCHCAITCLDEEQPRQGLCCCRLMAGPLNSYITDSTMSILANRSRVTSEVARQFLFEGNYIHVCGYEWVDCQPKQPPVDEEPDATKYQDLFMQEHKMIHDIRLAFLSLGAIKIFVDRVHKERGLHQMRCDCSVRWAIYHNLGIIYHVLGVSMGERGYALIHQCHACYSLAQATIPTLCPFGDIIHLFLSGQNNQMVIYQEFAMHNESKACLHLLRDLLAAIPTYYSLASSGLEPSDVLDHEILLNLMVLTRTLVAPAA